MATWNHENSAMSSSPSQTRTDHFSKMVARSNSAVTNSKSTTTKLRRHVKSEPVSSSKLIQENANNEQIQTSYPKRPNYLPIRFQKSQIAPGATDVRDLPGGRRFTPVNVSSSSSTMSHMTPNTPSSIYSPHMSTYTPKYSSSNGLHPPPGSSPSANLHTTTLFLEEENRQLRATVNTLKENARKVEFLQQSLDHVQGEFVKLSELCARKSQIDEKRIETLEAALKQMTLNYQHSKQQLSKQQNGKHQSTAVHKSPGTSENDLRASPVTGLRSSQTDLEDHARLGQNSSKGEMQSALNSFNFLLRALSEKDDEISNLKKRIRNTHQFGSDRSLDTTGGFATPTYEYPRIPGHQQQMNANRPPPTYDVEYLLYGNNKNGAQMAPEPPKVLTPPYEFEPISKTPHSNITTQPKPEVLGLQSI